MITEQQALEIARKFTGEIYSGPCAPTLMIAVPQGVHAATFWGDELLAAFREVERITAEACVSRIEEYARNRPMTDGGRLLIVEVIICISEMFNMPEMDDDAIRAMFKGDQHA